MHWANISIVYYVYFLFYYWTLLSCLINIHLSLCVSVSHYVSCVSASGCDNFSTHSLVCDSYVTPHRRISNSEPRWTHDSSVVIIAIHKKNIRHYRAHKWSRWQLAVVKQCRLQGNTSSTCGCTIEWCSGWCGTLGLTSHLIVALYGFENVNWSYYVRSLLWMNKCLALGDGKRRKQSVDYFHTYRPFPFRPFPFSPQCKARLVILGRQSLIHFCLVLINLLILKRNTWLIKVNAFQTTFIKPYPCGKSTGEQW